MAGKLFNLRSRWLWGLVLAAVAIGMWLSFPRDPRFGQDKFQQLHEGMTEDEVISVLGCTAGDYRPRIWSQPDWYVSTSDVIGALDRECGRSIRELEELERQDVDDWVRAGKPIPPAPARVSREKWWGRDYGILVAFDENRRLIHCSLWNLTPPPAPPDLPRRVRWWFGW
jgi:hypothetical protein